MSARARLTEPTGKPAELGRVLPSGRVQCTACARNCQIAEGQIGFCGVRGVVGGKLYLLVYGRVMAGHIDPIEKKPVVHYRPGSKVFSIATSGCSWACAYCQNSDISQLRKIEGTEATPEELVANALDAQLLPGRCGGAQQEQVLREAALLGMDLLGGEESGT